MQVHRRVRCELRRCSCESEGHSLVSEIPSTLDIEADKRSAAFFELYGVETRRKVEGRDPSMARELLLLFSNVILRH